MAIHYDNVISKPHHTYICILVFQVCIAWTVVVGWSRGLSGYIYPILNCNIWIHIYIFLVIQSYHYRSNTVSIVVSTGEIAIVFVSIWSQALQYYQISSAHALQVCVHKCTAERISSCCWVRLQWRGVTNLDLGILICGAPYLTLVHTFDALYSTYYWK